MDALSSSFNLRNIELMIDDPEELTIIKQQFKSETQKSLLELKECAELNKIDQVVFILHRLSGIISQFGGHAFSSSLKIIEKELIVQKSIDTNKHIKLMKLSAEIKFAIDQL